MTTVRTASSYYFLFAVFVLVLSFISTAYAATSVTPLRTEQLSKYQRVQSDGGRAEHSYGYRFTVFKKGRITRLGGRFNGKKTVVLIDNSTRRVIGYAEVNGSRQSWSYAPLKNGAVEVSARKSYTVAVRMGADNAGIAMRSVRFPFQVGHLRVMRPLKGVSSERNFHRWSKTLKATKNSVFKGLVDVRYETAGGGGSSNIGGSSSGGRITHQRSGDRLFVTSSAAPTWKLEFDVGSGAPGGGTAIGLYIPANSSNSVVESAPFRNCCSGLGLDNLEWRWRPFGSGSGTRSALGHSSSVQRVRTIVDNPKKFVFEVSGSWSGVRSFTRRTTVTPQGYSTSISAAYSGTTGKDSMWWLISMFHDRELVSDRVTIQDRDTGQIPLRKTTIGTPLPSGISIPYTINYPLARSNHTISMTLTQLADGAARFYEFFDRGNSHNIPIGPYYVIYPRWTSVFANRTYDFKYSWKLSR